jgi:hypothetical protein
MIKSPKSKVLSPKSIRYVGLLFVIGLFLAGCVTTGEYVYRDDTFRKEGKKVEEKQISEKEEEKKEEWIGSHLEEDNFIMQCPVCMRRYPDNIEKCPYDDAELEPINKANPKL